MALKCLCFIFGVFDSPVFFIENSFIFLPPPPTQVFLLLLFHKFFIFTPIQVKKIKKVKVVREDGTEEEIEEVCN